MNLAELKDMTPVERERLARRLFPALSIFVLYVLFARPWLTHSVEDLQTQVDALRQPLPVVQILGPLKDERKKVTDELAAAEREYRAFEDDANRVTQFMKAPDYESRVVNRLGHIFEQNHVAVISENRTQLSSVRDSLPQSVSEVARLALGDSALPWDPGARVAAAPAVSREGQTAGHDITVWSLQLRGSYLDVLRSMQTLNEGPLLIVTVKLDMRAPEGAGDPEWELVLWI